ncbi:FAD/NAD(P)-binding domain-containing protein [Hymenopellis radicata]|nr:FAD/NAD(P)-binding domain-containing protein [Hymenopellis radicata]
MQKTILILGAAYGGARAANLLANGLPKGWRVVIVDRNTHANHAYILPRLAVLPGHEHKAFIPINNIFQLPPGTEHPHLTLHAHVEAFNAKFITLSRAFPEHGITTTSLEYDYAIYALGSLLPDPLNLWGSSEFHGAKPESMDWLKEKQKVVKKAGSVLVVGGGALGVQFATDINALYPEKDITLLHSRRRLLPKFDEEMHYEILKTLETVGIDTILGERLDLASAKRKPPKLNEKGQRVVRTLSGREIAADLIMLCTGQRPHTDMLKDMDPLTVNPEDGLARVLKTMQLSIQPRSRDVEELEDQLDNTTLAESKSQPKESTEAPPTTPYPHIFVVGDCADAFGAIQAGHTAYYQTEVAARNILKLVRGEGEPLDDYTPSLPAIKVSLGITKGVYQSQGVVGVKYDGVEDMHAAVVWPSWGANADTDEDMRL